MLLGSEPLMNLQWRLAQTAVTWGQEHWLAGKVGAACQSDQSSPFAQDPEVFWNAGLSV